jgi:aspartate/methionine/tyrosine aminotransferase
VRQEFSDFLERRDGFKSDIEKIFLCNGASEAVRLVLRYFILLAPLSFLSIRAVDR